MRKGIIGLFVTLALSFGFSAMAEDEIVYNADNNSVTVSLSGYSTILIESVENGETVMINQNGKEVYEANQTFYLPQPPELGEYRVYTGTNGVVKTSSFEVTRKYPFSVSASLTKDDAIDFKLSCKEEISGMLVLATFDADKKLSNVLVKNPNNEKEAEFILENYTDKQTLKIMLWNAASLTPLSGVYVEPLKNIIDSCTPPPDVLTVQSSGDLAHSDGVAVNLQGVNFGGWMIQESWMCAVPNTTANDWGNLDTINDLTTRFGADKANELLETYQTNYITEADFKNVSDLGFNCIRIPFWYRNFMSDEDGTYFTENPDDNPGFKRLDWACDMAEKYGLYLIFEMHGCPGGQNGDHSSGKKGRNYLYKTEKYKAIMQDLWETIADRYKNRTCVAAYDIMNEPLNNADADHGVESQYIISVWTDTTERNAIYDRMIAAIRKVDPYHVITVEGIWNTTMLPSDPAARGWKNIMYQLHSYDSDEATSKYYVNQLYNMKAQGVATLMGEFNPNVYYNGIVSYMQEKGVNYTVWNYKTTAFNGKTECLNWGLYTKSIYSYSTSTADSISSLWSASKLATSSYSLNNNLYNKMK